MGSMNVMLFLLQGSVDVFVINAGKKTIKQERDRYEGHMV